MSNEIGENFRAAFLETLELTGTDCDVRGEIRRAVKRTNMKEGYIVFQFADEFPWTSEIESQSTPLNHTSTLSIWSLFQKQVLFNISK